MCKLTLSVLLLVALWLLPNVALAEKTVFIVRHAERTNEGDDLTPEGLKRAEALAKMMAKANLTTIITSDAVRSVKTAAPTETKVEITPKRIPYNTVPEVEHIGGVVKETRSLKDGETLLYVGHSNTIGPVVKAFASDTEVSFGGPYGNLWILVLPKPSLTHVEYSGEFTP